MNKNLEASASIEIIASSEKVWDALVNPEKIKVYLFGTEVISDWKEGSPIVFQGEYDGQVYKDKGNVLKIRENELLKYNYWSGFSGLEDKAENYSIVNYRIKSTTNNSTKLTWTQQGFASKDGQCHTQNGLSAILEQIKKLSESE